MMLEVGDILYVRPDYLDGEEHISINEGIYISRESILNRPFEVTHIRKDHFIGRETHDICIKWVDGLSWWWGQIGYFEPWTNMFITEKEYLRSKKIEDICRIT